MFDKPNYTQIPNSFFDELLPSLNDCELRVLLSIMRKTFGWGKVRDRISVSQIQKLTSLSKQGVLNGLYGKNGDGGLVSRKIVNVYESKLGNEYEVNVVDHQSDEVVNVVDRGGQLGLPAVVNDVDIQKKSLKETIQKKEEKHKHGQYSRVLLTYSELEKLKNEYPLDWEERITNLDEYIQTRGIVYKDHLATIRSWARKDKAKSNKTPFRTEPPKPLVNTYRTPEQIAMDKSILEKLYADRQ